MNRDMYRVLKSLFLAVFLALGFPVDVLSQPEDNTLRYLKNLSIEQLASIEVTTVSKTEEKLSDVDAAVYVITSEDIRRSGLTSIPEILRMAPGLQVARIDSNQWAISARGFNAWFADKLLVLIDGRSVYTPLFSGVSWNIQDTLLDDIERIEVIRGPGAALWGANAVNGVINIITKKAQETQGGLIKAGGGNIEQGFGAVRYGGRIGDKGYYRAYAKYFNRGPFKKRNGHDADDDWDMARVGFRMDLDLSSHSSLTLDGDIYDSRTHDTLDMESVPASVQTGERLTEDFTGGHLLGRLTRRLQDESLMTFQWYYDRTDWDSDFIKETRDTIDLDFQHSFKAFDRHNVVWGLEYRMYHDNLPETVAFKFQPKSRIENMFSGFLQDQISIIPGKLDFTLGTKLEHNYFSGFEVQPSGRLRFKPTKTQTFWAAVSRAVRTPSRADRDMNLLLNEIKIGPIDNIFVIKGSDDFDSEELISYEAGYRITPRERFSFDISTFYNVYRDLRATIPAEPTQKKDYETQNIVRVIPLEIKNQFHEDSYGLEASGTMQLTRWWKASINYSWLKMRIHTDKEMVGFELDEGNIPRNQFSMRSYMDLPYNVQFDTLLFYVDSLPEMDIPSYTRLDFRLGYHPFKNLSVDLKLQNMLDNRHPEYVNIGGIASSEVPRSFYGKITWHF